MMITGTVYCTVQLELVYMYGASSKQIAGSGLLVPTNDTLFANSKCKA